MHDHKQLRFLILYLTACKNEVINPRKQWLSLFWRAEQKRCLSFVSSNTQICASTDKGHDHYFLLRIVLQIKMQALICVKSRQNCSYSKYKFTIRITLQTNANLPHNGQCISQCLLRSEYIAQDNYSSSPTSLSNNSDGFNCKRNYQNETNQSSIDQMTMS